ncbi:fibroblast growth factor receptor 2-like [Argonauta hians]
MPHHWIVTLVVLLSSLTSAFPMNPEFITSSSIQGNYLIVKEGEEVSVTCKTAGILPHSDVRLGWKDAEFSGDTWNNSTLVHRDNHTLISLHFIASRSQHNRVLQCNILQPSDDDQRAHHRGISLQMKVYYLDKIRSYMVPSASVVSGSTVALVCQGSGRPSVNRTWVKPSTRWREHTKETVVFHNVSLRAAGTYICTMWNIIGETSAVFDLTVKELPSSLLPPAAAPPPLTAGTAPDSQHHTTTSTSTNSSTTTSTTPIIKAVLIFSILIFLLLFTVVVVVVRYVHHTGPLVSSSRSGKRKLPKLPVPPTLYYSEDRLPSHCTTQPSSGKPAEGCGPLSGRASCKLPNIPTDKAKAATDHSYVNTCSTHADYLELVDENGSENDPDDLLYEEPGKSCY